VGDCEESVSPLAWIKLGLFAAILAAAAWGLHVYGSERYAAGQIEVQTRWTAAELVRSQAAVKAEQEAREEEQRRITAQKEIADESQRLMARNRSDAAAADAAAAGLRGAVTAALAGGGIRPSHSSTALGSPTAASAGVVLPLVLKQAEQRLRDLAETADASRAAGLACVNSYEALKP
jgi:hypothetical protein